jgi:hypothetical protein
MMSNTDYKAEATKLLSDLNWRHDSIDVGIILCFALAQHKLDSLTDEQFLELVQKTLRKALADVKRINDQ